MDKFVIGIDPGLHGGIVILDKSGVPIYACEMPTESGVYNYHKVAEIMHKFREIGVVAIELVGFMGPETAKNITDLCYHAGVLFGIASAYDIPVITVPPSIWKKRIGLPSIGIVKGHKSETDEDKKKRVNENAKRRKAAKNVSITFALKLMPKLPNVASKITDGIAEASLIGEYARRQIDGTIGERDAGRP